MSALPFLMKNNRKNLLRCFYVLSYSENTPTIIDAIESRIKTLDILISRLEESIPKRVGGELSIYQERGVTRFYQFEKGKKKKYLGKDDEKLLAGLAQKDYEQKLLTTAKRERVELNGLMNVFSLVPHADINQVWSSLDEEVRGFVVPDISTDDGYALKWKKARFAQQRKSSSHRIETLGKDFVRSKSEALIADRLFNAKIPYRYEQLLMLDLRTNLFYYPDFTILNTRTRQVYYWEHLGLLGDNSYCDDNIKKLCDYADYGIIHGKNLILSYECEGRPLSTTYVNKMIEEFLK